MLKINWLKMWFVFPSAAFQALRALVGFIEREVLEKLGRKTLHRPEVSVTECGWALLDFGTVIVHVMTPETREKYNLESLWGK